MGFGHDEGVVIGSVEDILAAQREGGPDVLVVLDASNEKYPNRVACEFMPRNVEKLNGVAMGEYVKVVGSMRSREYNGRWYTNFVAYSLTRMDMPMGAPRAPARQPAPAPAPAQRGSAQHREVGADDDPLPF